MARATSVQVTVNPPSAGVTANSHGMSTRVVVRIIVEGVPLAASVLVAVTRTQYSVPGVRPVIVYLLVALSVSARRSVSLNSCSPDLHCTMNPSARSVLFQNIVNWLLCSPPGVSTFKPVTWPGGASSPVFSVVAVTTTKALNSRGLTLWRALTRTVYSVLGVRPVIV